MIRGRKLLVGLVPIECRCGFPMGEVVADFVPGPGKSVDLLGGCQTVLRCLLLLQMMAKNQQTGPRSARLEEVESSCCAVFLYGPTHWARRAQGLDESSRGSEGDTARLEAREEAGSWASSPLRLLRVRIPCGLPPTSPCWTSIGTGTYIGGATRVITCRMLTGHAGYTTAPTSEEEWSSSCGTCPEVFSRPGPSSLLAPRRDRSSSSTSPDPPKSCPGSL